MGPKNQQEKIETSYFDRIRYTIKTAGKVYFERPLYYLFYALLAGISVVLLFGGSLPWQLYIFTGILALIQIYQWSEREPKHDKKRTI